MHASGGFARHRPTRVSLVISSLVLALAAAGCSQGTSPPTPGPALTATPPTTDAAPSPSPSPTLPSAAQQPTPEGAIAFISYYFDIYDYAFWTANPAPLQSISDPGCVFCNSAISAIKGIQEDGQKVVGGRVTVAASAVAPNAPTDRTILAIRLNQESARTLSHSGRVDSTSQEINDRLLDVAIHWTGTAWILLEAASQDATPS